MMLPAGSLEVEESLYTQQWYMSYRFADSMLTSSQQTCMYCCVYSDSSASRLPASSIVVALYHKL